MTMSDLVKRLRSGHTRSTETWPSLREEAADRIEELEGAQILNRNAIKRKQAKIEALEAQVKAEREKALREAAELCDNAPSKTNQEGQNKEVESAHWCAAMIRHLIEKDATDG